MIPTIGAPVVGADLRVEVPVTDLGGNPAVRVDYAVGAAAPAESSFLWRSAGTVTGIASVFTVAQLVDSTVWIRASGRTLGGVQISAFTDPVSVAIGDRARFGTTSFTLDDYVPAASWTPSGLTAGVRVLWEVHAIGVDPGALANSDDFQVGVDPDSFEIPAVLAEGEAITIELQAWDGWAVGAVAGEMGETVSAALQHPYPSVQPHASRHAEGAADEIDAGTLFLVSPDAARWRLTVSNAGVLGVEAII